MKNKKRLTAGSQMATLLSAPNATMPLWLQSATAVCLFDPADKYSVAIALGDMLSVASLCRYV